MVIATAVRALTRECSHLAKLIAFLLFFVSPVLGSRALAAGERAAVVYPNATVSLNGVPITRATPVFPGETIATGRGAAATVISEGTQVALPENTVVTFGEHSLTLVRNSALIQTLNSFVARAGNFTISPEASSGAQFELKEDTSGTRVTVRAGSISIDDGRRVVHLDAGSSFVLNPSSNSSALSNPGSGSAFGTLIHSHGTSDDGGTNSGNGEGNGGRNCHPCRPPESPIRPCHHHPYPYADDDDDCRCRDDNH